MADFTVAGCAGIHPWDRISSSVRTRARAKTRRCWSEAAAPRAPCGTNEILRSPTTCARHRRTRHDTPAGETDGQTIDCLIVLKHCHSGHKLNSASNIIIGIEFYHFCQDPISCFSDVRKHKGSKRVENIWVELNFMRNTTQRVPQMTVLGEFA